MGRIKLNKVFLSMLDNCTKSKHRIMLFVLGSEAMKQVPVLHHVLAKSRFKVGMTNPSILWCFKNGCNYKTAKVQKELVKKYSVNYSLSEEDVFDHFISSADIHFCHFCDITSVLGQTFGMLVLQDFEAVTPNVLSHVSECIEGGGLICIILSSVHSLQEIPNLKLDAHSKYETISHSEIKPNFNRRLVLSLPTCKNMLVMDKDLQILLAPDDLSFGCDVQLKVNQVPDVLALKNQVDSCDVFDKILQLCRTTDQCEALHVLTKSLHQSSKKSVVFLKSARGRGKSAALGLSISLALHNKISNIFVTSPHVENVQTLFSFVIKGMNALKYEEGKDYSLVYSTENNYKRVTELRIFRDHRQVVKYFEPVEYLTVSSAHLVVIDEAAAIPLPIVKKWMKSNFVFIASTVCGYEGTGRSLSLKLINQLREQSLVNNCQDSSSSDFVLHEITLNQAIRYSDGDELEKWMYNIFCLNAETSFLAGSNPDSKSCQLFYINKDILFSYNRAAESFLQQIVSLFVSSHYKNCPNDLMMMADAPSHYLFCLLAPFDEQLDTVPNVLCVLQIALEGKIPKDYVIQEQSHGKRGSGDLIPWIVSQQFQDEDFPALAGARIVRIATHPNYQRMGYGKRTLELFFSHCQVRAENSNSLGHFSKSICIEKPVLLLKLDEVNFPKLDYIGVSYGLTIELLKFWKKSEFVPLYVRQTASEVTGEHSCLMVRSLNDGNNDWQSLYLHDFLERFTFLLPSAFKNLSSSVVLDILHLKKSGKNVEKGKFTNKTSINMMNVCDIKRLSAYCNHLVDYHLILDLLPVLARAYFLGQFEDYFLSLVQEAVLVSLGLQHKSVEMIAEELTMETNQIMGIFMKTIKKIFPYLSALNETDEKNNTVTATKFQINSYPSQEKDKSYSEKYTFKRKHEEVT